MGRHLRVISAPVSRPALAADQTRDRFVFELASSVTSPHALGIDDDHGITLVVQAKLFDILTRADRLASLRAELGAAQTRYQRHRRTHPYCSRFCPTLHAIGWRCRWLDKRARAALTTLTGRD